MTKKKYLTQAGKVVVLDSDVVSIFPEGAYKEVPDDTPLSDEPCCGEEPKTVKTITPRKETKNA